MSRTYDVRAVRWDRGWELHIDGVGVTQVRRLTDASDAVREYVEVLTGEDVAPDVISVSPELGELGRLVEQAREQTQNAARAQLEAAAAARDVTRRLRASGLTVDETAAILGVSKGRVSQLAS